MDQDSTKPKLYVGCALSQAPEDFRDSVEKLKGALRDHGYEVYDFIGLVNGTSADVYNWDIGECVANCAAFVAICDFPSLGLGFEMDRAITLKKPVLAVAHTDAQITRLVIGAAEVEPKMQFKRYNNLVTDVPDLVDTLLTQFPID